MKNLFNPADASEIQTRLGRLAGRSERQWGKMSAAQALAHCSAAMEWAVGDTVAPRALVGRVIGGMIKPMVLKDDEPMRRNSPTVKTLLVAEVRDLGTERERLSGLIERFATGGPAKCTKHPHSFFGRLTPDEWAILMYKHLDHHLRQFGQ